MFGSMLTSIQSLHDDVKLMHEVRESSDGACLEAFGRLVAGDRARDA
jgi:hypothetical protein